MWELQGLQLWGQLKLTHQVPPTQQLCLHVFPALWPPRMTCMQPLRVVASSSGIQAVTCSTFQLSGCR